MLVTYAVVPFRVCCLCTFELVVFFNFKPINGQSVGDEFLTLACFAVAAAERSLEGVQTLLSR